jgi:hypothetical protein
MARLGQMAFQVVFLAIAGLFVLCFVFGLPFLWYGRGK